MRLYAKFSETRCFCCTTRRDVIEMTGETLSFIADGSTLGHIKPVAYGTIKVHKMENGEIRKIARDVQTILSTSPDRMAQRSSIGFWMLSWLAWLRERLWKDTYRIRRMRSIGAAKPNAKTRCSGSVLKSGV